MSTNETKPASGPLAGLRVVEMAGLGPAPFVAMMLSDMGAEVIRIDAKGRKGLAASLFPEARFDVTSRGRRSLALDLKQAAGVAAARRLIARADALVEGFRPGVMERLGLAPDVCLRDNPRLVYGRMTGWGQDGPLAATAGHDINYLALSGALHAIGHADRPPPVPLNLIADYGGGAMMLAFGMVCALLEAQRNGQGQVVDAAMTDGVALLSSLIHSFRAAGQWRAERNANLLDGGAPYYNCYACADGRFISVGAIEPQFYALLCEKLGIDDPEFAEQNRSQHWPSLKKKLADLFATRTRAQWCEIFEGSDACVAPVLDFDEALRHPHNRARGTYLEVGGVMQPAPVPRLSRTPAAVQSPPPRTGEHTEAILREQGFGDADLAALRSAGAI